MNYISKNYVKDATGLPEYEAKRYEGRIHKGGVLLSVHCDDTGYEKRANGQFN